MILQNEFCLNYILHNLETEFGNLRLTCRTVHPGPLCNDTPHGCSNAQVPLGILRSAHSTVQYLLCFLEE